MDISKGLVCVCAVLLIFGTLAAEVAYEMSVKTSLPMMGETEVTSTVYIKGDKEKTESVSTMNLPVPGMTQSQEVSTTVIARLDKELIWVIDQNAKTYTEMSFSEVKKSLEDVKKALPEKGEEKPKPDEASLKIEVTRLEQKEKIEGYDCERVQITMTSTGEEEGEAFQLVADVWLAEEKGLLKKIADFDRRLAEMSVGEGEGMEGLSSVIPGGPEVMVQYQERMSGFEGLPLASEMVITTEGHEAPMMKMITRIRNVREVKLEDSEFELPEGHKKLGGGSTPMKFD